MSLWLAMVPADEAFIAALTIIMVFGVLVLAITMRHRHKMAELELRRNAPNDRTAEEIRELKEAVGELREALNAQVIAVDNMLAARTENSESLANRLEN